MNLRPVTLACKREIPHVRVEQQPFPRDADTPQHWITTIEIGTYPNMVEITFDADTPKDGRDAAAAVGSRIIAEVSKLIAEDPS